MTMGLQSDVERLAAGLDRILQADTDSLVFFYEELCKVARTLRRKSIRITRCARPNVENIVILSSGITLLLADRLSREEMLRLAEAYDEENAVNRIVYNLLDDAWRKCAGQGVPEDVIIEPY